MKMYLNEEQTAKLIELGVEKPKGWYIDGVTNNVNLYVNIDQDPMMFNYSVGELIEMLPTKLIVDDVLCSRVIEENEVLYYKIATDFVGYWCDDNTDLIDNLYDMIVKLKEEEVI